MAASGAAWNGLAESDGPSLCDINVGREDHVKEGSG